LALRATPQGAQRRGEWKFIPTSNSSCPSFSDVEWGFEVVGMDDKCVHQAVIDLRALLDKSYRKKVVKVNINGDWDAFEKRLQDCLHEEITNGLRLTFDNTNKSIEICALGNQCVQAAKTKVMEEMANLIREMTQISYPLEWEGMNPDNMNETVLVEVKKESPEWKIVIQEMESGISMKRQIFKIERVQNPRLWERYYEQKKYVAKNNNGDANEKYMKHGPSKTLPSIIYESDGGFDFRHSEQGGGMFGRGAYFAYDASYSYDYRYSIPETNNAQIFLALVIRGKIQVRDPDHTLVHPAAGYHSVEGFVTTTNKAIITYDICRAYPSYLITFQASDEDPNII